MSALQSMNSSTRSISNPLTDHADLRLAQRNLSHADLDYCCRYGIELHRRGECHVVLRRCDIPKEDLARPEIARLEGTLIVFALDGWIKTIFRDRRAPGKA